LAKRKRKKRTPRSKSENIMLVVGILVAVSMVLGGLAALFR
jgi:hypothetical protein